MIRASKSSIARGFRAGSARTSFSGQLTKPPMQLRTPLGDAASRLNAPSESKLQSKPYAEEAPITDAERLGNPEDPLDCREFDLEVYRFMRSAETKNLPSPDLFVKQTSITPRMRSTVIDWLVEVHRKLRMHTDTLYLTVMLIDQYLSVTNLDKADFQRLACAAVLLAGKNDELRPPSLIELVELCDRSFKVEELSRMEASLFAKVHFHVDPILSSMFLKRFLRLAKTDLNLSMLGHFILETSLLEADFVGIAPSKMAAAAVCLGMALERGLDQWGTYFEQNTGYGVEQLSDLVQKLLKVVVSSDTGRFRAIKKKYSTHLMCRVSLGPFPDALELRASPPTDAAKPAALSLSKAVSAGFPLNAVL